MRRIWAMMRYTVKCGREVKANKILEIFQIKISQQIKSKYNMLYLILQRKYHNGNGCVSESVNTLKIGSFF